MRLFGHILRGYRCDDSGNVISPVSGKSLSPIYNKKDTMNLVFDIKMVKRKIYQLVIYKHIVNLVRMHYMQKLFHIKNGNNLDNSYSNIVLTTKTDLNKIIGERVKDNNASMHEKYNAIAIYEYYIQVNNDVQKTMGHFSIGSKFLLMKLIRSIDPKPIKKGYQMVSFFLFDYINIF